MKAKIKDMSHYQLLKEYALHVALSNPNMADIRRTVQLGIEINWRLKRQDVILSTPHHSMIHGPSMTARINAARKEMAKTIIGSNKCIRELLGMCPDGFHDEYLDRVFKTMRK